MLRNYLLRVVSRKVNGFLLRKKMGSFSLKREPFTFLEMIFKAVVPKHPYMGINVIEYSRTYFTT